MSDIPSLTWMVVVSDKNDDVANFWILFMVHKKLFRIISWNQEDYSGNGLIWFKRPYHINELILETWLFLMGFLVSPMILAGLRVWKCSNGSLDNSCAIEWFVDCFQKPFVVQLQRQAQFLERFPSTWDSTQTIKNYHLVIGRMCQIHPRLTFILMKIQVSLMLYLKESSIQFLTMIC